MMKGYMTIGTLMAFYSFSGWIYNPLQSINGQLPKFQRVDALSERFFGIHDMPEEINEGKEHFPNNYNIRFKNISFKYEKEIVLENINLYIGKNEKIAFVGTSGSGKSTLVGLLERLYVPDCGEILLNNSNLKNYELNDLRNNTKLVKGNDFLFNMSVRDNISLDDKFTDEEFSRATGTARVDKFINKLDK
jgi:ABC-type bacteriocin/lantibiotic exporter with double-glycine peptidase domain